MVKPSHMGEPCLVTMVVFLSVIGIATAQNPQNIVVFLVDDVGWVDNELSYSQAFAQQRGDTDAFFETPNLAQMVGKGLTITQAYSSSPVCSPTRASLMLGQSPATHHVSQWIGGSDTPGFIYQRSLPSAPTTLAEAFDGAGYRTGHVGKWHLGSVPTQHGFQENYGGANQGSPASWFANSNGGFSWATGLPDDGPQFAGEYLTDRLTRDAVDFINNSVFAAEPFFLELSHYGVHVPFAAPQPLIDKYVTKLNSGTYAKFDSLTPSQRLDAAKYAAMVEAVDNSLGQLNTALTNAEVAQDTLVVFTSDNGGLATTNGNFAPSNMNAPLRNGKGTTYEGGIRVPMVVAGPGVIAGATDTAVITHDLYPTLLAAAGIDLPNQPHDGIDLTALFSGQASLARGDKPIVVHYPHYSPQGGVPAGVIIDEDWKLRQDYEHGGVELYDLSNDLSESVDLELMQLRQSERMRSELHQFFENTGAQLPAFLPRGFALDTRDAGIPLKVVNGSFEVDVLADGTSGSPAHPSARTPSGWAWVNDVILDHGGVANPAAQSPNGPNFPNTSGQASNGAMDQAQMAYLGSVIDVEGNSVSGQLVGFEQELDAVLQTDSEYTIRFAAGARTDQSVFVDGLVRLLAGNTVIAELETFHDPNGLFRDYQLVYGSDQADAMLLGQPLRIQLLRDTSGGQISFDNVRFYQRSSVVDCDYDGNGTCNVPDIDMLTQTIAAMTHDPQFDLTADGMVNLEDLDQWLADAGAVNLPSGAPYLPGDADLNGIVDFLDFNRWLTNRYMDDSAWSHGDFNASGIIDLLDFDIWVAHRFQVSAILESLHGSTLDGNSSPITAVPEATARWLCLLALWAFVPARSMR